MGSTVLAILLLSGRAEIWQLALLGAINGFAAAFTAPMLITGSARIYSIFTSQAVFNGQVIVQISTDGKFMITGKLNFAGDNISISGRLYADLSKGRRPSWTDAEEPGIAGQFVGWYGVIVDTEPSDDGIRVLLDHRYANAENIQYGTHDDQSIHTVSLFGGGEFEFASHTTGDTSELIPGNLLRVYGIVADAGPGRCVIKVKTTLLFPRFAYELAPLVPEKDQAGRLRRDSAGWPMLAWDSTVASTATAIDARVRRALLARCPGWMEDKCNDSFSASVASYGLCSRRPLLRSGLCRFLNPLWPFWSSTRSARHRSARGARGGKAASAPPPAAERRCRGCSRRCGKVFCAHDFSSAFSPFLE